MNNEEQLIVNKILQERETRVSKINKLINKHSSTVVCIRANYPGLYKNNIYSKTIVQKIFNEINNIFKDNIIEKHYDEGYEGPTILICLKGNFKEIKLKCVMIEEIHVFGRIVDIDVYSKDIKTISREELGFNPRKCYICNNYSQICVRSQKHSLEEVEDYIKDIVCKYVKNI